MTSALLLAPHFPEYCLNYANALSKRMRVVLFCDKTAYEAELGGALGTTGAEVRLVDYGSARTVAAVLREAALLQPAIVHFQEASGRRKAMVNLALAGLLQHRHRVIMTVHDPLPHSGSDGGVAARTRWMREAARWFADTIVVHGAYCRAIYEASARLRPQQHLIASVHGTILDPTQEQQLTPSRGRFLFFGRMESYKGLDVLVQALEHMRGEGLSEQVIIAGKGPELDRLRERLVATGMAEIIDRFLDRTEVISLMQRAEIVLLPYKDATQSGVVPAAFANARTVIASRVGGLPDIVEDGVNGLLVEPSDPLALARAMSTLADDRERTSRLRFGAEHTALTALKWDRIVEQLLSDLAPS